MTLSRVLIANRGEVAIRIARACADLGLRSTAVYSEDDAASLHVRRADAAIRLPGRGAAAYLDIAPMVTAARDAGCDAVHPGYGFLSENPAFATACAEAGITFVGPSPAVLASFGDKVQARAIATAQGVKVPRGTVAGTGLAEMRDFLAGLGGCGIMVKAVSGGGGRGMRAVTDPATLEQAWTRCGSEARAAFGSDALYAEELIAAARHVEVQILGDGTGAVTQFGERDCTIQRRHQKLMEVAPSPGLLDATRAALADAAVRMASSVRYRGLGTFEFLVDATDPARFVFIEANPRLQVEHTVTEEVYGVDLVQAQLRVAGGATLDSLGLGQESVAAPRGFAIQLRVNMEVMHPDGGAVPAGGIITAYEPPTGPGIRVDGFGYAGYQTSPFFDSLLAKLIVRTPAPSYAAAVARARRAVAEFRVVGVDTNLGFLEAMLAQPDVAADRVTTNWLDGYAEAILAAVAPRPAEAASIALDLPRSAKAPPGTVTVPVPMQGLVVALDVAPGDVVRAGQQLGVLEAMKMEHVVGAPSSGVVHTLATAKGVVVQAGQPLLFLVPGEAETEMRQEEAVTDPDEVRADLQHVLDRHALLLDSARPEAVAKRHGQGGRTARENVADLCDAGSFIEYGGLAIAAQRTRRSLDELLRMSPADGLIAGLGTVNAALVGEARAAAMVIAYDYTVLAGTQGTMNHKKQDRMFQLAGELRRPLVLFAEGGGGRPGDVDKQHTNMASLDVPTFHGFARLSGLIPLVGIVHGRCFAGNAALLGCCDVIIATRSTTVGMGGPAMIEGGGLGVFKPEEVGPAAMQAANGVIDVLVEDEAEAVAIAKRYLAYFQGPTSGWTCPDQRLLRGAIPENRLRSYDVRAVIAGLADDASVLELRSNWAAGMVTALIRIEGRPMGLIANNSRHLGGAIDADAADKAARFLQLCDAHDLPILSLCDTPGFMVGPDAERTALVRRVCRMFVGGANLTVPFFTVVLRKGYGLGAQAMAAGCFHAPVFNVSWPTGEFGGMGLEGAVRLGFRKELAAIADADERDAEFRRRVDAMYARGKATSMASVLEIDNVIDPADTRRWIAQGLRVVQPATLRTGKKRPNVDTW